MSSDRIRVVVLFGGQSAEHDVSCTTARHVIEALDRARYRLEPIGITRAGEWVRDAEAVDALDRGATGLPDALTATGTTVQPLAAVVPDRTAGDAATTVVFPLLHGPKGEDGTVQGLLELAGVPYVGAGVLGSAVAMDKITAKQLAEANGIPQVRWRSMRSGGESPDVLSDIASDLGFPCFVKPANMGSSVGVSKAWSADELADAVAFALGYDEFVVIEEAVIADEIEVGVLGNTTPRASVPGRVVPANDFYDYADKYLDGQTTYEIPAPLADREADEVRALAVQSFLALRADGMARCDFFHEADGRGFLLNEINTIPGFTPFSMYPKLWEASGLSYPRLLDELIALALDRHRRRSGFRTDH
ncbi:MAG TPA: D-alanine--D-alanine ligase family protein [Acidimicrobiales bacterium]|nr:D-alanine--D-alanine ligase family protein [Acidimicrobiales bacterium]